MRHRLTRIWPYSPEDLFDLIGDVEAYPRFVRWLTSLKTSNPRRDGEGVTVVDAEAKVAFSVIHERFSTKVRLDRPNLAIDVSLLSGPFRRLENHWRFKPNGEGAELTFDIDVEFRSRLLESLLAANAERAAAKLVACFEIRAAELYGENRWKRPTGS